MVVGGDACIDPRADASIRPYRISRRLAPCLHHTEQIDLAGFGQIAESADCAQLVKNRLRNAAGLLQLLDRDILLPVHRGLLKRHSGIKDYGHIFPGHGGVMDRFDSVIFTLIVMYCYTLVL